MFNFVYEWVADSAIQTFNIMLLKVNVQYFENAPVSLLSFIW